jgi:hypothetical protein
MKPTLAQRMRAIAAGQSPTRRRNVLTTAQAEAVYDVAVLVGRCLVQERIEGGRFGRHVVVTRRPAPAELIGVLP